MGDATMAVLWDGEYVSVWFASPSSPGFQKRNLHGQAHAKLPLRHAADLIDTTKMGPQRVCLEEASERVNAYGYYPRDKPEMFLTREEEDMI